MGWAFAARILASFVNVALAVFHPRSRTLLQNVFLGPIFDAATATMCGIALWAIWHDRSWARRWAAGVSSIFLLEFLRQFLVPMRPASDHYLSSLIVGTIGVAAFLWRDRQAGYARSDQAIGIVIPVQIKRYKRMVPFTYNNRYSPAIWAGSFVVAVAICFSLGLVPGHYVTFMFAELCITYFLGFLANFLVGALISPRNQATEEPFDSSGSLHLSKKPESNKKSNP